MLLTASQSEADSGKDRKQDGSDDREHQMTSNVLVDRRPLRIEVVRNAEIQ